MGVCFALLPWAHQAVAGGTFFSDFKGVTAPNWVFGTEAGGYTPALTAVSGIDPVGDGWLRLTTNGGNQSNFATFEVDLASINNRITVTFDYTAWGGSGADGITWFLYDAAVGNGFSPGGFGGSLGYANRSGIDGLTGGFLGVGVDTFGNYSQATEGRNGGIGFRPDEVALRGPGSGQTGYQYLAGTGTGSGNPSVGVPLDFAARPETNTATEGNFHRMKMELSEANIVQVFIAEDPLNSLDYRLLFTADMSAFADDRPDAMRFGFAASTGGATNYHEVRSLSIFVSDEITNAFFWDGRSNGRWRTNDNNNPNWQDSSGPINGLPATYANVFFEDHVGTTNPRTIRIDGNNDINRTRTVSSLNFDHTLGYTLGNTVGNGTMRMEDNDNSRTTSINVTDFNGVAAITHTINSNILATETLIINNSAIAAQLNIAGAINMDSNDLRVAGQGTTTLAGNVTNATSLTKTGAGTLNITGQTTATTTTIEGGVLSLNRVGGSALVTSTIQLEGGTLLLDGNDQISATADLILGGGTLALNDKTQTLASLTLTENSVIDMGTGSGGVLTLGSITRDDGFLYVNNWSGNFNGNGPDRIIVSGLPGSAVLDNIAWVSQGSLGARTIDLGGGLFEIVPIAPVVPEPATVFAGVILLFAALCHALRRRLSEVWRRFRRPEPVSVPIE